jgi:hypothetical protein
MAHGLTALILLAALAYAPFPYQTPDGGSCAGSTGLYPECPPDVPWYSIPDDHWVGHVTNRTDHTKQIYYGDWLDDGNCLGGSRRAWLKQYPHDTFECVQKKTVKPEPDNGFTRTWMKPLIQ